MRKLHPEEAGRFLAALKKVFREPMRLVVHDNSHVFLNVRFRKKNWTVRLHWMFLKAPDPAVMAEHIAQYTFYRKKKSSRAIDRYIEEHWHWVRHRLPPLKPAGKVYDLEKRMARLNRLYLEGRVDAKVTWGKERGRRGYEQIMLGSYSTSKNLITLHPCLDRKSVPAYVVEATLFHEMCHALLPVRRVNGRRQIHPPAFKKLEALYPHLQKTLRWEEKNLNALLRGRK